MGDEIKHQVLDIKKKKEKQPVVGVSTVGIVLYDYSLLPTTDVMKFTKLF